MRPPSDDTVLIRPPLPPPPPSKRLAVGLLAGVAAVLVVLAGGGAWWITREAVPVVAVDVPRTPPISSAVPGAVPLAPAVVAPVVVAEPIPLATEAAVAAQSPAVRTVLRFSGNPAIVILDFPTLSEQGRMLNRIAAWVEKAGVPHDRLLQDRELDAAIQASGTTADTYYYGHDYRGEDVVRFFVLADRDGTVLRPEEQDLRRLVQRAQAEPAGFGALISVPRADAANAVTPQARATILHHELSHGEYFTNPAYAAFVDTVWRSVLTDRERASFRTYLASEGYDPALEDLMKNEMQAYLMHTADPAFFDPSKLGIPAARLAQIRASFLAGMPPGWLRDVTQVRPRTRRARRQRPGRVSRTTAVAATVPPRRRRASMAA